MHHCEGSMFWCPRCGTIKSKVKDHEYPPESPSLVPRVKEMITVIETAGLAGVCLKAHTLGVYESIGRPTPSFAFEKG
jgi:hypothetical protein